MRNANLLLLLLLAMLWGPSFLFIKIAVLEIPPLSLVAIRLTLGAGLLYLALRLSGRSLPSGTGFWAKFAVMGLFASAIPFVLFSFGEQYADSGAASILNGTTPIFTTLLAHMMIAEERLSRRMFAGVAVGFAGVLLIFFPDAQRLFSGETFGAGQETIGLVAFVLASLCYGFSIVYGRRNLRGLPPLVGPTAQLISAAAMILPVALIVDQPFALDPGLPALLSAVTLGVFGTALAYLVYYRLLETAGATFISLVTYILPLFGVVLGMVFLDEQPGWYSFAGMGLILAGVLIVNRARRPARV